ncbi:hypothetical protein GW915_08770 [bacterium]|nr:hypothetical protein [bacterium]
MPSIDDKLGLMRAVVDIGSNTIKVLVGQMRRSQLIEIGSKSIVARLAKGLKRGSPLPPDALVRAEAAFVEISNFLKAYKEIKSIDVLATASLRKASNPEAVALLVEKYFKTPLTVISGEEEARLSAIGAKAALSIINESSDKAVFFDLGGASTEISIEGEKKWAHSFEIGAVSSHDLLNFPSDQIDDPLWESRKEKLDVFFQNTPLPEAIKNAENKTTAVAAGGTLLQMASAMKCTMPHPGIFLSKLEDLTTFLEKVRRSSEEDRINQLHIEKGRADIFPAGVCVFEYLCQKLELNDLVISSMGIRHGFLIDQD